MIYAIHECNMNYYKRQKVCDIEIIIIKYEMNITSAFDSQIGRVWLLATVLATSI